MSIEKQRRAIAAEFSETLRSATDDQYARKLERLLYMREFITQFPKNAPTAWDALLGLRQTTDLLVTSIVRGDTQTDLSEAVRIIQPYAGAWCKEHLLSTRSGWLELLTADTLAMMPLRERLEVPGSGFSFFDELFVDIQGDEAQVSVESIDLRPEAKAIVFACPGFQEWDMLAESRARFRDRAIAEYTQRLDQQIDRAESQVLTPALAKVNHNWIRWTLLRRAEGKSVRAVAKQCGVSRQAVNKGVAKVSAILGFIEPVTATCEP
jgi:hypothetical protein